MDASLELTAEPFAFAAHSAIGQRRKYTNDPYIVHPRDVANLVRTTPHGASSEVLAAAYLHDVVEDTQISLADIRYWFGDRVAELVEQLTDVSRPEDGNRAVRKSIDRAHTALACPEAKTIKLADLIVNSNSIIAFDPGFAKVYMAEKEQLLVVLLGGDQELFSMACQIVSTYYQSISQGG